MDIKCLKELEQALQVSCDPDEPFFRTYGISSCLIPGLSCASIQRSYLEMSDSFKSLLKRKFPWNSGYSLRESEISSEFLELFTTLLVWLAPESDCSNL
jgi:hypothetical protein